MARPAGRRVKSRFLIVASTGDEWTVLAVCD